MLPAALLALTLGSPPTIPTEYAPFQPARFEVTVDQAGTLEVLRSTMATPWPAL